MHFIYVLNEADRDKMMNMGYTLIKEDTYNHICVFKNRDTTSFSLEDEIAKAGISFIMSDTLAF